MLNKEICKKCWEREWEKQKIEQQKGVQFEFNKNNVDFDKRWSIGGVLCLKSWNMHVSRIVNGKALGYNLRREDEPPESCPYHLEHVVNAE